MRRLIQLASILTILVAVGLATVTPAKTQPNLTIQILSGGNWTVSVTKDHVQLGRVDMNDQTQIEITADVNWKVTASVTLDAFPAGTQNPTNLALEVGSNDTPGQFNAGGGLVQTGAPGTVQFPVDLRLNLATLGNAPAGTYSFTITYTIQQQ